MFPILFRLGPLNIYSYGTMVALAFIVSLVLLKRDAKRYDVPYQLIVDFCFWVLIWGIIGARVLYIILNIDYFRSYPQEIFKLYHGGLVLHGGLILGSLAGIIYLKKRKTSVFLMLNIIAPYIALAQAIGRIGCLLNGCCYGYPSKFGLFFPVHNAILIPTQIYSSLANLAIFILLKFIQQKASIRGNIFIFYILFYSIKRFIIEFFRADSLKNIWGLSIFQIISIVIFTIGIVVLSMKTRWKNSDL